MKRAVLVLAVAMVLVGMLAVPALADDPDGVEQGLQGGDWLYVHAAKGISGSDGFFATPGDMFKFIRDELGMTPKEWVVQDKIGATTVGEFIYERAYDDRVSYPQ